MRGTARLPNTKDLALNHSQHSLSGAGGRQSPGLLLLSSHSKGKVLARNHYVLISNSILVTALECVVVDMNLFIQMGEPGATWLRSQHQHPCFGL